MRILRALGAALLVLVARTAAGQETARPGDPAKARPSEPVESVGKPLAGALVGGAGGALVGGLAGFYIGGDRCIDPGVGESCQYLAGLLIGTGVGFTLGAPVGAHIATRGHGSLTMSLLASGALAAVGAITLTKINHTAPGAQRTRAVTAVVIVVPLLQSVTSAVIEARTRR